MLVKRGITVNNHSWYVDVPDACPICHRHGETEYLRSDIVEQNKGIQAIFRCAYIGCRSFFICGYGPFSKNPPTDLLWVRPMKPNPASFPDVVTKLSPTFLAIYQEADEAAHLGLKQVAGPGYRKAFEFLIKDYAKAAAPGKAAEIEAKFSGAVVNEYVADARLQAVAKRCLWLGNDESHYLRKWTDKDLGDLVTLIKLTSHWIEMEHLSKSYVAGMPE